MIKFADYPVLLVYLHAKKKMYIFMVISISVSYEIYSDINNAMSFYKLPVLWWQIWIKTAENFNCVALSTIKTDDNSLSVFNPTTSLLELITQMWWQLWKVLGLVKKPCKKNDVWPSFKPSYYK